ncbi:hypothetical protein P7C70_g1912, partial [Phenoliferia sp. Uapishka_3]
MAEFCKLSIFGTVFEVTTRYVDLQPVGMGAFGLVCSAKDEYDVAGTSKFSPLEQEKAWCRSGHSARTALRKGKPTRGFSISRHTEFLLFGGQWTFGVLDVSSRRCLKDVPSFLAKTVSHVSSEAIHALLMNSMSPSPDVNQFSIITELLGTPPEDVIQTICSENTLRFVQSLPKRERIPFAQKFRGADPLALDLLEKMLVFDPRKRIDATQALAHEYLAPYHDPSDEPIAPEPFDWSFNDADLPVDTWKIMMYAEILDFHKTGGADESEGLSAGAPKQSEVRVCH